MNEPYVTPTSNDISGAFQTMVVVWGGIVGTQLMFVALIYFVASELFTGSMWRMSMADYSPITYAALAVCLGVTIAGFVIKKRIYAAAAAAGDPARVMTGLIIGCALAEFSSLIGVVFAFAFHYQHFFIFSALGIISTLLHFPSKAALEAASFKKMS